jgi:anion-transporting  ArsA/GET3 family ATPase
LDPRDFCRQSRVLIVAGKGGVGKTTVAASMARMAAGTGLRVCIVDVEGGGGLAGLFGVEGGLDHEERVLDGGGPNESEGQGGGEIIARALSPEEALVEYFEEHGMGRLSRRLARKGVLQVAATAAPGLKDILVLGKVKQLERAGVADLIVIDAPASGHAFRFLASARGMVDMVRGGPLRAQAEEVLDMLTDDSRSQVILVTLPEETPVNEAVESAFALEDRVGVSLGPVVVNGVHPVLEGLDTDPEQAAAAQEVRLFPGEAHTLAAAARFRSHRQRLQQQQAARLAADLPLPQLQLPALLSVALGPADVDVLAAALAEQIRGVVVATGGAAG